MKNQYVGDINDYRKYAILRVLAQEIPTLVVWMLTPDDELGDGNLRKYLKDPWR